MRNIPAQPAQALYDHGILGGAFSLLASARLRSRRPASGRSPVELLEPRLFLSGDTTPPTAALESSQPSLAAGQTTYTFYVDYNDDVAVSAATVGANNVEVTGPNGFDQIASYVGPAQSDAPLIEAAYQITAPNGTFSSGDDGSYAVNMLPFQASPAQGVSDTSGNGVAPGAIGDLDLDVQPTSGPTAVLDSTQPADISGQTTHTFYVDYSSDAGIDSSSLGNSNVEVVPPEMLGQAGTVRPDGGAIPATFAGVEQESQQTVIVAYQFNAPDGTFSSADDGAYTVEMIGYTGGPPPTGVDDYNGVGVPAGAIGTLNLSAQLGTANAPVATLQPTPTITSIGDGSAFFYVEYTDDIAVDTTTFNRDNVIVTGPNGYEQTAEYAGGSIEDGPDVLASYAVPSPGVEGFTSTDNGTYTVSVEPYSSSTGVGDTSGNGVAAGAIGTFDVNVSPDMTPPTASVESVAPIPANQSSFAFTVDYSDDTAVDTSTLGNDNLEVTGPNGFDQIATFVSATPAAGGPSVQATYQLNASDGNQFTSDDAGDYNVSMLSTDGGAPVADTSGNVVPAGPIGGFQLDVLPPDTTPPQVSLNGPGYETITAGQSSFIVSLTYTDDVAVDSSTIGNSDIEIIGPNGFNAIGQYIPNAPGSGPSITADYVVYSSEGQFTPANNGVYTIIELPYVPGEQGVADTSGNGVVAGAFANLDLMVQDDATDPSAHLLQSSATVSAGTSAFDFQVEYVDNNAVDSETLGNNNIIVTGPDGQSQYAQLVSPPEVSVPTLYAVYQISAPDGTFSATDAGNYTVSMVQYQSGSDGVGVADVNGNGVPAGPFGAFDLAVEGGSDGSGSNAPTAQVASAEQNAAVGASTFDFFVDYTDGNAIDASSLGNDNVNVVNFNTGFEQTAQFIGQSPADGPFVQAEYQISAPNGSFSTTDQGTYEVSMLPYSPGSDGSGVDNVDGVGVPSGPIGTFSLEFASQLPPPPAAQLASSPSTVNAGALGYYFAVTYNGQDPIDATTLSSQNVTVTAPNGSVQTAQYVSGPQTDGTTVQALYEISASNASAGFSGADNGNYTVSMVPYVAGSSGVASTDGQGVAAGQIGAFSLTVAGNPPAPRGVAPVASLAPGQGAVQQGQSTYAFYVDYKGTVAINISTLGPQNVQVTGPNGFSQVAQYIGQSAPGSTYVQALYQITAPNGSFDASATGTYTVSMLPFVAATGSGVADISGSPVTAGSFGTFNLQVQVPAPTAKLVLSNVVYAAGAYNPGGTLAAKGTITNMGNATAQPFTLSAGISASGNFSQQDLILLATASSKLALAPGQSTTVTIPNASIPASTASGAYYFGAQINYSASSLPSDDNSAMPYDPTADYDSFESSTATITVAPATPPAPAVVIGGLNTSFGTGGVVTVRTGLLSTAAVALQSNGKSIAIGEAANANGGHDFGVARFNADGSIDTSFGASSTTPGTVYTDFGGDDDPVAVAIQSDGKIVVAGSSYALGNSSSSSFVLARYNPDGSLDTTFGSGGMVTTQFASGSSDIARDLVLMPNGQILLVGESNANGNGYDFALARYNANGSLDTTFNKTGTVLTDFAGGDESANAVFLEPTGQIVVAGSADMPATGVTEMALARYNANGTLDSTFGTGGRVLTPIGAYAAAYGVAVESSGQIVAVGGAFTGLTGANASSEFVVARYNANGTLDPKFASAGIALTNFSQPALATQVQVNADGSLLVGGATAPSLAAIDPAHLEVGLAAYTSAGKLDPTFGSGGITVLSLGNGAVSDPAPARPVAAPGATESANPLGATVGVSLADTAAAALAVLSQQRSIAESLGVLTVVTTSGSNTVIAQVVASSAALKDAVNTTLPATTLGGAKASAVVTVTDSGNKPASGAVKVLLYASLNNSVDSGDTLLATLPGKLKLKPGGSAPIKLKFALPASLSNGNYYVIAEVEPASGSPTPTLTAQTATAKTITVAPRTVDLAGAAFRPPTGLSAGSTGSISLSISNAGNVAAAGSVAIRIVAADGPTPSSSDVVLASPTLHVNLPARGTHTYPVKIAIPKSLAAGSYYMLAQLTPSLGGGVSASSESFAASSEMTIT